MDAVVQLDLVRATCRRAASVVVTPRTPTVHQPLRISPCALVEANLMHIRQQPLGAPAQHSLLNLNSQKREKHKGHSHHTGQADNPYSPPSKGHIELDTKDSENSELTLQPNSFGKSSL
jgi:hypothetical protein